MDEIPFRLIVLVLVIGGAILKPWLARRKKKLEEQQRKGPARLESEVEPPREEQDDGPKLPYEDLVDEVFGSYMERRREVQRPKPAPRRVVVTPAEVSAPAPPRPALRAPAVPPEARPTEVRARLESSPTETAVERRTIEQILFENRSLSGAAKLILAAEILQPPRVLRGRAGSFRR